MNSKQYYKPSGRFTPAGLLTALAVAGCGTALAAVLYAYAIAWIPFVYVRILLVIGMAMAAAALTTVGITAGKVRNAPIAIVAGTLVGILGLYVAWVAWLFAQTSQEVLLLNPTDLAVAIQALTAMGVWSIKGTAPTGWGLYAFWIVEALAIVGAAAYGAYQSVADSPFCERCNCWMEGTEVLGTFENPSDQKKLISELELERQECFQQLRAIPQMSANHTVATREQCPECQEFQLLTLTEREMTSNKDGQPEVKEKKLLNRLVIEPSFADALGQHWARDMKEKSASTGEKSVSQE